MLGTIDGVEAVTIGGSRGAGTPDLDDKTIVEPTGLQEPHAAFVDAPTSPRDLVARVSASRAALRRA